MERPPIKDKKILEYIEHLEAQLSQFDMDSIRYRSYRAMTLKIDEINDLLSQKEHRYEDPVTGQESMVKIISFEALVDKDDKFVDRIKVFMKELPDWISGAEKLLEKITKEKIREEESKYGHKSQDYFSE